MHYRCVLVLPLVLAGLPACDYIQPATQADCTALFDHIVDVGVRDVTGEVQGTDQAPAESGLLNAIGGALGRAALEGLGEKDKFLNRCQATMRRYEVQNCLKKRTMDELKPCGAP